MCDNLLFMKFKTRLLILDGWMCNGWIKVGMPEYLWLVRGIMPTRLGREEATPDHVSWCGLHMALEGGLEENLAALVNCNQSINFKHKVQY